jgi:hypothetical protein
MKWSLLLVIILIIAAGCTTKVPDARPSAEPATGSLDINSTPPGAEVYLDGIYKGTTPVRILDVPGGSHTLELRHRDCTSWSKTLEVPGGTKTYVDASLSPGILPTTIQTTVPAPAPTTVPRTEKTTIPTTEPTTVLTTAPVPGTPAGCWKGEATNGYTTEGIIFSFQPGGTGQMSGYFKEGTRSGSQVQDILWSVNTSSGVVTVVEVNPANNSPREATYSKNSDTLVFKKLYFARVPCNSVS